MIYTDEETEKIKAKIEKNREKINNCLHGDFPLEWIYARIRMLSAQNERLIEKLKQNKHNEPRKNN